MRLRFGSTASFLACAIALLLWGCDWDRASPGTAGPGANAAAPSVPADSDGIDQSPFDEIEPPAAPEALIAVGAPLRRDRPNLVLISIDTLRADRLGAYGHDRPTSPTIDRFAADAVLFENAVSQAPVTAPSHATLFTGLYPEAHRVQNMFDGEQNTGAPPLAPQIPTLAEMLRAAGYATAARVGGGNISPSIGFGRGFDSYVVLQAVHGWRAIEQFTVASEVLSGLAGQPDPFFLFVHTYETHAPYLPLPEYRSQFVDPDYAGRIIGDADELDRIAGGAYLSRHRAYFERVDRSSVADRRHLLDLYDACIRYADDAVAVLLDRIESLGIADHTIVVLLSDHGEQFGEHGGFEHDALWQEVLHVPLVMRVPEGVRPGWHGRRVSETVGLVDVVPTLLALMDLPAPDHLQGHSLVARVEDDADEPAWAFSQYRARKGTALLAGDWKWLHAEGTGPPMLFDLSIDPDEFMDRSEDRLEWRRTAAAKVRRIVAASRGLWALAAAPEPVQPSEATRRQLEALGYVDAPPRPDAP